MQWWFALLVQLLFSYLATVAFAIIINVPRKALNLAGWAGVLSYVRQLTLCDDHVCLYPHPAIKSLRE
ncbi:hypothetical protein Lpp27_15485, partial [Lacticaseibacillus paracasei subsp. paracasei CNCM I-4648]